MTRFRLYLLASFFILALSLIVFRAFQLQLLPHENVELLAKRQLQHRVEVVGRRGTITDRNGQDLAVSVNSMSVFANPSLIRNPPLVASTLSKILDVPEKTLLNKLRASIDKKQRFIWLERQLNAEKIDKIEKLDLKHLQGIGVLPEFRREYPNNVLASHLLGFVSVDGVGLEGVERSLDKHLRGEKNALTIGRDALGRPLFTHRDQIRLDMAQGEKVVLSIDASLQFAAEKALRESVEYHKALGGTVIVMDPRSGEILAMANNPEFDPNELNRSVAQHRRNRALTDPIEPGSVIKPFVVARALDEKIVTPKTMLDGGNGFIKIGKKTISEADEKHRFKRISVSDLIRVSSNVGTVVLGQKLGFPKVFDTFKKIGLGKHSGIELQGESRGILLEPSNKQILEQATYSFGQGFASTPIQIAAAYSIIANGGYSVQPTLIRSLPGFNVEKKTPERVFSEQTMRIVREILERVVEDEGTGTAAKIEGFRVAGKTGTSQKIDASKRGYEKGSYWSSFAGMIPSQNPRYVIYTMIDQPTQNGYYGGSVAAPVFAKVAGLAMRLASERQNQMAGLNNKKKNINNNKQVVKEEPVVAQIPKKILVQQKMNKVPALVGDSLPEALRILSQSNLEVDIQGQGEWVVDQLPAADSPLPSDKKIYLKLR